MPKRESPLIEFEMDMDEKKHLEIEAETLRMMRQEELMKRMGKRKTDGVLLKEDIEEYQESDLEILLRIYDLLKYCRYVVYYTPSIKYSEILGWLDETLQ